MPITPFLRGQVFDPELIVVMSSVFVKACANLGLSDVDDAMTQQVARHVIEAAQRGIRTDGMLYLAVMQELKPDSLAAEKPIALPLTKTRETR